MRNLKRYIKDASGYDPAPELEACGWCIHAVRTHQGKFWWCVRDPKQRFRVNRYGCCNHFDLPGQPMAKRGC